MGFPEHYIKALALVISGGPAYQSTPPIGIYRTGKEVNYHRLRTVASPR